MSELLSNYWLLLPALAGVVALGLLSLRYPIVLVCLSIFTNSLDYMGRIGDTTVTYNGLTKVALLLVLLVHMLSSKRRIQIPRPALLALPFVIFIGIISLRSPNLGGGVFLFLRLMVVWAYTVILTNFIRTRRHLVYLLGAVVLTAMISSGFAYLQTLNMMTLGMVETLDAFEPGTFGIRAVGTFWNPNRLGLFLLNLSIFMLVGLTHRGIGKVGKGFLVLVLLGSLGAILLTFSRAAWTSLSFALLLFLFFRDTRRIVAVVMVCGVLMIVFTALFTPYGHYLQERAFSFGQLERDFSTQLRVYLGYIGASIWADGLNWIWGGGYASFKTLYYLHFHPLMPHEMAYHTGVYSSHVLWMTLLAEAGVVGLLLFLVFIRAILKEIRRLLALNPDSTLRLALVGCWVLVVTRVLDWFFNADFNYNEFWFTVGLVGALGAIMERERQAREQSQGAELPLPD